MVRAFWVMLLVVSVGLSARAEVFLLDQGGKIEGRLLNPDESPRRSYVIKTPEGITITLNRAQVKQVVRRRPNEEEYERIRPRYPDTVEGQFALAEWCRQNNLPAQRRVHLERVIELDPNHVRARHGLGYSQVGGRWITQKEAMKEQGLEWYKGRYRTRQEIELLEERQRQEAAEKEWMQKINRWESWLGTDKAAAAREALQSIRDPAAVKGLVLAMRSNPNPNVRLLFVAALGRIGTQEAQKALATFAIEDPVEEVRLSCLDILKVYKTPAAVDFFVGYLRHKDNRLVNRAGVALGQMGDPSAIGPLIDALVTTHKYKIQTRPPGQTTTTFGMGPGGAPGPAGLSIGGGGPRVITEHVQNRAVLDALSTLTGVNYGFDVRAWRAWYTMQRKREAAGFGAN